ncbi:MAG: TauD/TfdA dioxygenase family protein, partial [Shimia sp.]
MRDLTDWTVREARLDVEAIREAVIENGVACVRDAHIDDAEFMALMTALGEPMFTDGETAVEGFPMLNVVTNAGRSTPPRSRFHSDSTYFQRPPFVTGLRVTEVPKSGGGTVFTDQRAALTRLDPVLREKLAGATVLHSVSGVDPGEGAETEARHPLIRRQPETGA